MNVKCELVEKVSNKSGKSYIALFVEFPNGYKRVYFPEKEKGEMFIWKQALNLGK